MSLALLLAACGPDVEPLDPTPDPKTDDESTTESNGDGTEGGTEGGTEESGSEDGHCCNCDNPIVGEPYFECWFEPFKDQCDLDWWAWCDSDASDCADQCMWP